MTEISDARESVSGPILGAVRLPLTAVPYAIGSRIGAASCPHTAYIGHDYSPQFLEGIAVMTSSSVLFPPTRGAHVLSLA
jgi:hypothetical protein